MRHAPASERELAAIVTEAASARTPLAVEGGGTRVGLGRPMQTAATVTVAGLTGVTLYEPSELVISLKAGTALSAVEELLAQNRQRLAFEPIDHRTILGASGVPTIGAVAAANLSGPRRIQAGAARDSLIGIRAVTGRGDIIKNGGRVMKNVTGYDLVKFMSGSYGTMGIFTEVSFKLTPIPEAEATLVIRGLDDRAAVRALSSALGSPWGVTGAAHLPAKDLKEACTLIRLDGFEASVNERIEKLSSTLAGFGAVDVLPGADAPSLWKAIRDVTVLGAPKSAALWRISVKPSDGPDVVEAVSRDLSCQAVYDWGGGLIWLAVDEAGDTAGAAVIRAAVARVGGHATLVRAADSVRVSVDVFEPQPPALMDIQRRLKATFDPEGILNPGRMYAGL